MPIILKETLIKIGKGLSYLSELRGFHGSILYILMGFGTTLELFASFIFMPILRFLMCTLFLAKKISNTKLFVACQVPSLC